MDILQAEDVEEDLEKELYGGCWASMVDWLEMLLVRLHSEYQTLRSEACAFAGLVPRVGVHFLAPWQSTPVFKGLCGGGVPRPAAPFGGCRCLLCNDL